MILRPRFAVHLDPELAGGGEWHPDKLDFEILVAPIILDRNSQVRFHKTMKTKATRKISRARACARTVAY
jgi:hypothetical protein